AQPVQQALPVVAAHQHHGEHVDLVGLHQAQRLEQLVEGAEAARHHHEAAGVLHEHGLAGEEVAEVDTEVDIVVHALLVGQLDPRPTDTPPASFAPRLPASITPGPPPVITA